jgi:MtN3 and saliva related transmembrane protein
MATDNLIEFSFALSLFINAALFIPQCRSIMINKDSREVSFITFFGFWLIQLATTLHGFLKHDYLLAFGTLASMVTCGYVIWLIVYYRLKKNKKNKRA